MKLKLSKLASNTAYLGINWAGITSLSFLFWLVVGKLLQPEELGAVSTSYNLASALSFVTLLGMGTAVYKLIPEYLVGEFKNKISSLVRFSLKIILITNIILIFVFALVADYISLHLKMHLQLVFITLIMVFFFSISNMLSYILLGFQRMKTYTTINIAGQIIRIIFAAILTILGFSFFGPPIGIIVALASMTLFQIISLAPIIFQTINHKWDRFKELFEYSKAAFIGRLSNLAFNNSPFITLTLVKDLTITGIFTPAMLLSTPLSVLPLVFNSALFPIISEFSAKIKSVAKSSILLSIVLRYTLFVSFPLAIFLTTLSSRVVVLLFRPEYLEAAPILTFLAWGVLLYGIGNVFLNTIYALKRPNAQQNILLLVTITFLVSSIILTYYFSLSGMVIAYIITAILQFLMSFVYVKKLIAFKLPYEYISKIIVAGLIMFAFIYYFDNYVGNLFSLILVIPAGILYLSALHFLRFYTSLDVRLVNYIYVKSPTFLRRFISPISSFIKKSATDKFL